MAIGTGSGRARKIALFGTASAVAFTVGTSFAIGAFGQAATQKNSVANADASSRTYYSAAQAARGDTGKLLWHYQHLHSDQWDFDWAF